MFRHYTSVQKSEFLRQVFLSEEKIRPANSSKRFRLLDMDINLGEPIPRLSLSHSMKYLWGRKRGPPTRRRERESEEKGRRSRKRTSRKEGRKREGRREGEGRGKKGERREEGKARSAKERRNGRESGRYQG